MEKVTLIFTDCGMEFRTAQRVVRERPPGRLLLMLRAIALALRGGPPPQEGESSSPPLEGETASEASGGGRFRTFCAKPQGGEFVAPTPLDIFFHSPIDRAYSYIPFLE